MVPVIAGYYVATALAHFIFVAQGINSATTAVKEGPLKCGHNGSSVISWNCPPWSVCRNMECKCRRVKEICIQCGSHYTMLQTCACLSYDDKSQQFKVGTCIFSCQFKEELLTSENGKHDFERKICNYYNRTGTLCGECVNNHWPLALSYRMDCKLCPRARDNWWKYILLAYAPTTILYIVVLVFKLDLTKPHMRTFIVCAQILSSPVLLQKQLILLSKIEYKVLAIWYFNIVSSVYGVWSLDFFRAYINICLELNSMQLQALEYLIVLYPLYLLVLTQILGRLCRCCSSYVWRPIRSCFSHASEDNDTSKLVVDVYATFFVVSLSKLLSTSITLLIPVTVNALADDGNFTKYSALYVDGSKDYFGSEHFMYGVLALIMLFVLGFLPSMLIMLYSFKCLRQSLDNKLSVRTSIHIHYFVDKFQGCYKNGSGGTRNYRLFSLLHFVLITIVQLLYGFLPGNDCWLVVGGFLLFAASLFPLLQPYKEELYSKISFSLLVTLGLWHLSIALNINGVWTDSERNFVIPSISFIFAILPMCYFFVAVAVVFLRKKKCRDIAEGYYRSRIVQFSTFVDRSN